MSQTELHIGKLRKIELKQNQSLEDFCKNKFETLRLIKELPITKDSWVEYFKDEFYEKYFVINNVIWEIFDHEEKDDSDDIYELKPNEDGTLSFIMKFYNGGTCLSECIEEELKKLK